MMPGYQYDVFLTYCVTSMLKSTLTTRIPLNWNHNCINKRKKSPLAQLFKHRPRVLRPKSIGEWLGVSLSPLHDCILDLQWMNLLVEVTNKEVLMV